MRLPSWRGVRPPDDRDEWLATAATYARLLTETGSRCHLNDGRPRFCSWEAAEWWVPLADGARAPRVGVRCTSHPGGRYLDARARLDPDDFA
jgi:hypothetical protein